jgi:hypothetical protein
MAVAPWLASADRVAHCGVARAAQNTARAWWFILRAREAYSPEAAAELNGLLAALPVAITRASAVLRQLSNHHSRYVAADTEVAKILIRINELMDRKPADLCVQR